MALNQWHERKAKKKKTNMMEMQHSKRTLRKQAEQVLLFFPIKQKNSNYCKGDKLLYVVAKFTYFIAMEKWRVFQHLVVMSITYFTIRVHSQGFLICASQLIL